MNRRRALTTVLGLTAVPGLAVSAGCGTPSPESPALPESAVPCASRTTQKSGTPEPTPAPTQTKLAWRAEERSDRSVRMTVGDVAAAPRDDRAVRTTDYKAPGQPGECDRVRIVKAHGWWCTTTASGIRVEGEIVVGGAEPRARVEGGGFGTRCTGRLPGRMRQVFQVQRDSWSGWRSYGPMRPTAWTAGPGQKGNPPGELCPTGRVGTYNYRPTVRIEIEHVKVGNSWATGPQIRNDCGTGVS